MAVYCRINGVVASVMESAGRFAKVYRRHSATRSAEFAGDGTDIHRHLLNDANPESFERGHAPWMIGEQADARDVQVGEDLRTDPDLPLGAALVVGQGWFAA